MQAIIHKLLLVQVAQESYQKGQKQMTESILNGFGYGVMVAIGGLLIGGIAMTTTPILIGGIGGALVGGLRR